MKPFVLTGLIDAGIIGGVFTAQLASADPAMCSFQGEYFSQQYECLQGPPSSPARRAAADGRGS